MKREHIPSTFTPADRQFYRRQRLAGVKHTRALVAALENRNAVRALTATPRTPDPKLVMMLMGAGFSMSRAAETARNFANR